MIDHYEIESRRPGAGWEHVGNVYPDYNWTVGRPWYLLWLVRRPRVTNPRDALKAVSLQLTDMVVKLLKLENGERTRIFIWHRSWFGRLSKTKMMEF